MRVEYLRADTSSAQHIECVCVCVCETGFSLQRAVS